MESGMSALEIHIHELGRELAPAHSAIARLRADNIPDHQGL